MHITRRRLCKLNMSISASTNIQESKIRQTQDFQLPDTFPEGVQIVYLTAWSEMHSVMNNDQARDIDNINTAQGHPRSIQQPAEHD